jgi:hypothetical protein
MGPILKVDAGIIEAKCRKGKETEAHAVMAKAENRSRSTRMRAAQNRIFGPDRPMAARADRLGAVFVSSRNGKA